ncbi:bifunctional 2-C-methyl-D-erythritol 4-phosphate cytidylyltransferase/2-C-methyl-D-erythritol 2,4-cyclodiphosphate synthase [Labrenzia sp. PHM005]|uniref:bifunctional 2-C-methyl-D-erythritol 4-phosphate cytidylyltransferase/2-C-methyl-D-erythritol 2,4-cyclodiphosphate synthase n=1 Tax=Labrenzia sp. PHM005 TaxID=2590016 RepID=UPI0011405A6B|nr:bifunctional 2-C-methyl-D-erythritol 4-phosphate cytidylyltransferase/2-C-methyl-D-erythritol 2,4-cyclodiphosphate synthase [Labrenzia sp. PHM005]QDG77767.1 bifunctional 2-C-methyl-D-erythritol 4-phosphate cytidylyltransferase/2-C-methyl-D-erythritol 2,4-cyclodiphosphate synthase [Labrenzia sp. PHM005]
MPETTAALVVAAGRGSRMAQDGSATPKQYRTIAGAPILSHTLNALGNHPGISRILTVIHADDAEAYRDATSQLEIGTAEKLFPPVIGGKTRQQSVFNGLTALEPHEFSHVLIHDAARPFLTGDVLNRIIKALHSGNQGVLAAVPVVDTLKRQTSGQDQLETVDRSNLFAAQTPQAFQLSRILAAHRAAAGADRFDFTDDTSLAEWHGMVITLSDGDPANFKITTPADMIRAEQQASFFKMTANLTPAPTLADLQDVRTGIGYDVHAFEDGEEVILGGISIPHDKTLKGHSDADVVLHAITDATLGAIGDGDIGQHFPPSDPKWKGAASDQFQIDAVRRVRDLGGRIAHIDVTVVCEAPKIGPHREAMRKSIAEICGLSFARVSVKATTSEKLGFTGRKEGIAALASVTVRLPLNEDE